MKPDAISGPGGVVMVVAHDILPGKDEAMVITRAFEPHAFGETGVEQQLDGGGGGG